MAQGAFDGQKGLGLGAIVGHFAQALPASGNGGRCAGSRTFHRFRIIPGQPRQDVFEESMVVRDVEQARRAGLEGVGAAEEHEAAQAHFADHGDGLRLEGQVTVSTIVSGACSSRRQHQRDDPAPRQ